MISLLRFLLGLLSAAIILLAVALWGLRLAMVNVDYFKPEIEYLLTGDETSNIAFTGLSGKMNRFNPVIRVENVSLTLPDRSQPLFIDHLTVEFDFWATLWEWAPVILEVEGRLEKIELTRDESGRWWANQTELRTEGGDVELDDLTRTLVFVPRYLKLDLRRLVLNDRVNQQTHLLERVSAQIDHPDENFLVQISAALPESLGRSIVVKSSIGPERSLLYVNTSDLRLQPAAALLGIDHLDLREGVLDGELWVNLAGLRLLAVNGDVVLSNAVFQSRPGEQPLAIDLQGQFNAIRRQDNWRVIKQIDRIRIDERNLPGFRAQMQVDTGDRPLITAWIDRLQLSRLTPVAGYFLPPDLAEQVEQLQPDGLARNLTLVLDPDQPENLSMAAELSGFENLPVGEIPGFDKLDGRVLLGKQTLALNFEGQNVRVDARRRMRAPFELDRLEIEAVARREGEKVLLAVNRIDLANADIRASGRMWLEAERDQRPFAFIRAEFGEGRARSKGKYLPLGLMPEATFAWLDQSIVDARIPRGELQYHGRLRDIRDLDREMAVEFFVDFEVADGELRFVPGWDNARDGHGRVLFHNVSLDIELDRVAYGSVEQARAKARIENLGDAVLQLEMNTRAPAAAAVETWLSTPVAAVFRDPFAKLHDFRGQVDAEIGVELPLKSGGGGPRVRVDVDLKDAAARSDAWGIAVSEIDGSLQIRDERVSARGIRASFFGDPVEIDVTPEDDGSRTLLNVRGAMESRNLLRRLPDSLNSRIEGKSDWQLRLSLPGAQSLPGEPMVKITAASNLADTGLRFPAPFDKDAASSARISVDVDIFADALRFVARYADRIRARGEYGIEADGSLELAALDVAFDKPLKNSPETGLNLYGHIAEIDLDQWRTLLQSLQAGDPGLLNSAELTLGKARAFGREIDQVDLSVEQTDEGFIGLIDSLQIRGAFEARPQDPVRIELEYLRVDKTDSRIDAEDLKPSDLPAFVLSSQQLEFHQKRFDDLLVETRVQDGVYYVDRLQLRHDQLRLQGSGKWEYFESEARHATSLKVSLRGNQFGQSVDDLGMGNAMRGGTIDFNGSFGWPSPLFDFSLETLRGDAKLNIADGVLNNVDPGGGRLVGLLSLSAIPRRLSLDFNDLLIEGMEFDRISGSYRLEQGQLYTRDTRMDGPAAKIEIQGRTGILDRDYDQVMQVTPRFRDMLNLALLLQSNWGLLLLQNLFKKQIDKAAEIEYKITGSWDNPKIELLKAVDENQVELPNVEK